MTCKQWRTVSSSAASSTGVGEARPKPSPPRRAALSARPSHHKPNASMMTEAMLPRPGAANGVVPKNGIGIALWIAGVPGSADIVVVCASAPSKSRRGRSSPLDRRSVSRSCLDRVHIGRSREGFGCRFAGLARTANGGKEIVQAGRQIGPGHLKLIRTVIDDLVSDAGRSVDGRARDEWVRHSVDDNGALSREAEQDLLVGRMRMLAHIPAGRDDLYPHRKIIGASVFGA